MLTALALVLDIIAAFAFDREQYVRCSARVGDQKLSPSLWGNTDWSGIEGETSLGNGYGAVWRLCVTSYRLPAFFIVASHDIDATVQHILYNYIKYSLLCHLDHSHYDKYISQA